MMAIGIDNEKMKGAIWQGKNAFGDNTVIRIHPFDGCVEFHTPDSYGGQSIYLSKAVARAIAWVVLNNVAENE